MTQQRPPDRDRDLFGQFWQMLTLAWRLMLDGRVGGVLKLIPVMTVLYIFSPIDFIPDILLPFGVMDDVGALFLGLQMFIRNAPPEVVAEHRHRLTRRSPFRGEDGDVPRVIEGEYEVHDEDETA